MAESPANKLDGAMSEREVEVAVQAWWHEGDEHVKRPKPAIAVIGPVAITECVELLPPDDDERYVLTQTLCGFSCCCGERFTLSAARRLALRMTNDERLAPIWTWTERPDPSVIDALMPIVEAHIAAIRSGRHG